MVVAMKGAIPMLKRAVTNSEQLTAPTYSFSVTDGKIAKTVAAELGVVGIDEFHITGERGNEGDTLELRATVSPSHFSDSFQWFMGDKCLSQQNNPVLTLVSVPYALDGVLFSCQVRREGPQTTLTAMVSTQIEVVAKAPTILCSTPPSQVKCGDHLRLTATGTNLYDEQYQWYFNGHPLTDETSSKLVVTACDSSKSGCYALKTTRGGKPLWSEVTIRVK